MTDEVAGRKAEHVALSLASDIAAPQAASWADVRLVHRALPEVDLDNLDLAVAFLGRRPRAAGGAARRSGRTRGGEGDRRGRGLRGGARSGRGRRGGD